MWRRWLFCAAIYGCGVFTMAAILRFGAVGLVGVAVAAVLITVHTTSEGDRRGP